MSRRKIGVVVAAGAVVLALVFVSASATAASQAGPIYFGMDAPLTGPTQLVGQAAGRPSKRWWRTGTPAAASETGEW